MVTIRDAGPDDSEALDRVLAGVRAEGYTRLSLWVLSANDCARRFYERYGFAIAEQKIIERHGHATCDIRYERELEHL
jgi:ribosomal protein S18 acetylase RimI-like enzyme